MSNWLVHMRNSIRLEAMREERRAAMSGEPTVTISIERLIEYQDAEARCEAMTAQLAEVAGARSDCQREVERLRAALLERSRQLHDLAAAEHRGHFDSWADCPHHPCAADRGERP